MNGAQQVARFSATQRLEKRIEDLELVLTSLAAEVVQDRAQIPLQLATDLQVFNERVALYFEREAERLNGELRQLRDDLHGFIAMGLWQRLRWAVRL